ncbi:hypothetical protein B0H14DRAFT_2334253, partial [Mycena olivaceomarginata]
QAPMYHLTSPIPTILSQPHESASMFSLLDSRLTLTKPRHVIRSKTGRPPPQNYDKWFKFAREKSCLIDDYDQIHRDFKPFYDLAQDDPRIFQRRLDVAFDMVRVTLSDLDASKTLPLDEGQPENDEQG